MKIKLTFLVTSELLRRSKIKDHCKRKRHGIGKQYIVDGAIKFVFFPNLA